MSSKLQRPGAPPSTRNAIQYPFIVSKRLLYLSAGSVIHRNFCSVVAGSGTGRKSRSMVPTGTNQCFCRFIVQSNVGGHEDPTSPEKGPIIFFYLYGFCLVLLKQTLVIFLQF